MISVNKVQPGPAFQSGRYKVIKKLPNMICACCGQKVIDSDSAAKAWAAATKPLSTNMKKGAMDYWFEKYPQIGEIFQKFAKLYPKKSLDKIICDDTNFAELLSAATADVIKLKKFKKGTDPTQAARNILYGAQMNSRTHMRSANIVMQRFAAFKDKLHGVKKDIFEQLQIYAKKYPRKTISEIINTDDIYKFHAMKDLLQRTETREKMDYHFANIKEFVTGKRPDLAETIDNLKLKALDTYDHTRDPNQRLFQIRELYLDFLKENHLEILRWKILDELKHFPPSFTTVDSFLAYARNHGYSDGAVIASLLFPSMNSFEHIIPKSKNGGDKYSNGLVFCRECNRNRDDIPYKEFLQYHPEMIVYTQKQMDLISQYILNGNLPAEYNFYPIKTSRLLYQYSDGAINLDIKNYCKKALVLSKKRMEEKKNALDEAQYSRDKNIQKKAELEQELESVNANIDNLNKQVNSLIFDTGIEDSLQTKILNYLDDKKD